MRTNDVYDGVGDDHDVADTVEGLTGVGPLVLLPRVPDGQRAPALVTGPLTPVLHPLHARRDPRGLAHVTPVEAPDNDGGRHPYGLTHDVYRLPGLGYLLCRGRLSGRRLG